MKVETFVILISFLIVISIDDNVNGSGYFGRDWLVWTEAKKLINDEIVAKKALGFQKSQYLKSFDLFTHGLKANADKIYMVMNQNFIEDINLITGKGVILKPDANKTAVLEVQMPYRKLNTCGFIMRCISSSNVELPDKVKIYWKRDEADEYEYIERRDTREKDFDLNMKGSRDQKVLMFDIIPGRFFKFEITTTSAKPVNVTLASINKCIFNRRHIIKDCGEKLENNPRFKNIPYGEPIAIRCPVDCIRTWPCWGFRIYSSDSPICWTATQNFGRWGNGEYTLYKIKRVFYFREAKDLKKGHGIYCRKSGTTYPGYTFNRKYYDFAVKEEKKFLEYKKKNKKN